MSRVVILKSGFRIAGGLEKVTLRIARALLERGHEVEIITSGNNGHFDKLEIPITSLGPRSSWGLKHLFEFDRWCRRYTATHPADVVLGMDRTRWQTHIRLGNGIHRAYLKYRCEMEPWTKQLCFALNPQHHLILHYEKRALEAPTLQCAIANSYMVKNEVSTYYAVDPSKVAVVHNGVEWTELAPLFDQWPEAREKKLRELGLDPGRHQFLFVGHEWRRKGLMQLLQGLHLLPKEDWELSVVGYDRHPEIIREAIQSHGLTKNVHLLGVRNDVPSLMQAADSLVIPSIYDPFANVTVEGLAMGLFVVSSSRNGGKEVLNHENGRVIDDLFDPDSMKESLEEALQHPKTEASAKAIRQSVAHLDYAAQLDKVIQCLLTATSA